MKVSKNWLQKYFEQPLPDTKTIADALTFHAFEIEESDGDMLDVKVLPNRAADCLCHRGIAKELSAILGISLKDDSLRTPFPMWDLRGPTLLKVEIEDPEKCLRYMGAVVRGVKIGPSPTWLKEALESVGQRSINNIVDATNYVMLDIGQPLHAFDAANLKKENDAYAIKVRDARKDETMTILSGEEYVLPKNVLLITDANADAAIGIAGVKGGKLAGISDDTVDIIVESANFDGTIIRRGAQALKLVTDASLRFQNRPSPELCAYAMRDVLALITEIAGGEVVTVVDNYPSRAKRGIVQVPLQKINSILGSDFSKKEVIDVFERLELETKIDGDVFTITPPFERTDLTIPEDFAEEVGRILGYDRVSATEIPLIAGKPDQKHYRGIERVKDFLVERGFTEISTQSFAEKGDIYLANPLDKAKPALRKSLDKNMEEALERAKYVAPLVLAPNQKPKLFEIGTIFTKDKEEVSIKTSEPVPNLPTIQDDENYKPQQYHLGAYKPFSIYPFIVRDIAFWAPAKTEQAEVEKIIRDNAGELLARIDQFDRFEKEGRISLASRLVFQSFDRTLTDEEVNDIITSVSEALSKAGFEVR